MDMCCWIIGGAIGRWAYFFDKNGVNAIYSSRDIFWEEEKTEWEEGNLGVKLFGMGGSRTVEMDQADTLLNYGIAGIIIVYSFYLSLVVKAFRKRKINPYARFVFGLDVFHTGGVVFCRSSAVFRFDGHSVCVDECINI